MSLRTLTLVYFLFLLGDIVGIIADVPMMRYVFKPLLMIVLGVGYYMQTRKPMQISSKWLLAAIALSWLGDVALIGTSDVAFQLGLVSFLLAHLAYIITFGKDIKAGGVSILRQKPYFLLFFAAYWVAFLYLLRGIGDFFIPVVVYATVLLAMGAAAFNRYGWVSERSFKWVFMGALLFVFSDSLIATNKFLQAIPFADVWIMLLYTTSQYLIVRGCLMHEEENRVS